MQVEEMRMLRYMSRVSLEEQNKEGAHQGEPWSGRYLGQNDATLAPVIWPCDEAG